MYFIPYYGPLFKQDSTSSLYLWENWEKGEFIEP